MEKQLLPKNSSFKSGYVAISGQPNVGKSTLLNRFLGEKLAIVSEKPQTTQTRISGIKSAPHYQIIFLDTPGIHQPKHKLGEYMMEVIQKTLEDVDLILYLTEVNDKIQVQDGQFLTSLIKTEIPTFLVINKIDKLKKMEVLLPVINQFLRWRKFVEVIPISALKGENLELLERKIVEYLPLGPQYFPSDQITEESERFLAAELIREKIFQLTGEEIPYAGAVKVEEFKLREEKDLLYIRAFIFVEKASQKRIIIGAGGQKLKQIGTLAREEMEVRFGHKVYLDLWVKVKEKWRQNWQSLRDLGYR